MARHRARPRPATATSARKSSRNIETVVSKPRFFRPRPAFIRSLELFLAKLLEHLRLVRIDNVQFCTVSASQHLKIIATSSPGTSFMITILIECAFEVHDLVDAFSLLIRGPEGGHAHVEWKPRFRSKVEFMPTGADRIGAVACRLCHGQP